MRLASFSKAGSCLVGPIGCSPERDSLKVRFSDWTLSAPLDKPLHDLT